MKSKIEQKIEKAREATNEMFAALEELNESLKEKEPEKYLPKVGEYYHTTGRLTGTEYIGICEDVREDFVIERVSLRVKESRLLFHYVTSIECWNFRPATPSEIALLDSKLAEQGKRFDKEKLELVDIEKPKEKHCDNCSNYPNCGQEHNCFSYEMWEPKPKHKEPIIGEMAIMWDAHKSEAFCAILINITSRGKYEYHRGIGSYDNAILFESPEQYKTFLKS